MMTVIELYDSNKTKIGYRVFCKGASEILLSKFDLFYIFISFRCNYIIAKDGQTVPFTDEKRDEIMQNVIQNMAQNGLRTICIAYKDYIFTTIRQPLETEVFKY